MPNPQYQESRSSPHYIPSCLFILQGLHRSHEDEHRSWRIQQHRSSQRRSITYFRRTSIERIQIQRTISVLLGRDILLRILNTWKESFLCVPNCAGACTVTQLLNLTPNPTFLQLRCVSFNFSFIISIPKTLCAPNYSSRIFFPLFLRETPSLVS